MNDYHIPVLPSVAIEYLKVTKGGKYIDCTLGGGGHTEKIIELGGIVLGIDQDIEAINYSKKRFSKQIEDKKLVLEQGNFAHLKEIADKTGFNQANGILFDLGVSTHQLEVARRGFSFNKVAKLDMRKDPINQTVTAADLIAVGSEKELTRIFWEYGEENNGRAIAREIVRRRTSEPIVTTEQLANIVLSVRKKGKGDRTHPATRTFQALRIAVNDELETLREALNLTVNILIPGGRLVMISFHSLEDRIVKEFLKKSLKFKILTAKPVGPTLEEVEINSRSRSGKLRAAEKLAE